MRLVILLVAATSLILVQPDSAVAEEQPNDLILILDASNSMWGQIDGENKIVIARRAVGGLVDGLPEDSRAGLVAYGHRREGDCEDIEVVQDVDALRKEALKATINGIMPKGKTPITASLETAFGIIDGQQPTSVILISDGLETCSRDPCDAVRTARQSGLPFVLHVVGFDVAGEDTTQLECAAQEGGGLFLSVENAEQLSEALVSAYEKPQTPAGRLIVTTTSNGALQDAAVQVLDAGTGEWVAGGRTYVSDETNPRRIPLEDGSYRAKVAAAGISGASTLEFEFDIVEGGSVERSFDFSSGEVAVLVTRNGELSDATVRVLVNDSSDQVAAGRTYVAASSNPRVLTVPAGTYDIEVKLVRIKGDVLHRIEDVVVTGNERTDVHHDYASGTLNVAVMRDGTLVDAVVQVYDENGASVVGKRAYADESRNPVSFELIPGQYLLKVRELSGERREIDASVMPGEETAVEIDFANQGP
ncbi:MAG: VWA domain-containing protein [Gammaproteobacteria bacterium]|nr:VWA domain-containing protein [Gammaproteobacteria bacterium]NNF49941.1 VWA domain-containing protein [Woeseiaceae bacterium]MBT8093208.1 VWA domain-containing protein [Gammaproteobacteria bacterium]MBT8106014.1 VWA domain-containing protein [Gammaproteobacteria bacterium]NNK26028.1 VWA domain-containing protein [Woeseiaceae bacterium]